MKKINKIISIFIIFTMLLPFVPFQIFANEYGEGSITFQFDISRQDENFSVSGVTVNECEWTDHNDVYLTNNGEYSIHGTITSLNGTRPELRCGGPLNDYMNGKIQIRPESETEYSFDIALTNIGTATDSEGKIINFIGLSIDAEEGGEQGQPGENGITGKVTINITGEELEYDMPWSEDAADFVFGINDSYMRRLSKDEVNYTVENDKIVGLETKNEINYEYNYNNEGTVTFNIKTQWDDVITSLKINGDTYNTPQTKEALINAFDPEFRGIKFNIPNVPYAETYNIEVVGRKQTVNEKIMGNFGWTYDPNTNEYSDDDKIPYGKLEFVKAVYNDVTYNSIEAVNAAGGTFEWNDGAKGTSDPTGEAMFPTGTELTIRLIPDAGYQLTSFDLNGFPFEPGEEVGLYTFTIGGGNWHLGAHFTKVSDEVQANSVNIKSGNIDINTSGSESFENGTAKLEVNDVASMSPSRMEEFEGAANAEGYEIQNYLDISLYNTVYKGGRKDENGNFESWDTPVERLEKNATVALELEENMEGKDIIVIHETHEGDKITGYEVVDTEYNAENNTITFKTDSFSNYAIATKESKKQQYTVQSGDFIAVFSDDEGHEFKLTVMELWNLKDEDLAAAGLTKEEYEQAKKELVERLKTYGIVLNVYNITIENEDEKEYTGEVTIKIKMTDEMKKYNSFKLICIDNDTIGKQDVVELKEEDGYLVGKLYHLSNYALVAENVEKTSSDLKTGDSIITFIILFAVSTLGVIIPNKSKKTTKH